MSANGDYGAINKNTAKQIAVDTAEAVSTQWAQILYWVSIGLSALSFAGIAYYNESINHGMRNLKFTTNPSWTNPENEPWSARWGINLVTVMIFSLLLMLAIYVSSMMFRNEIWAAIIALAVAVLSLVVTWLLSRFDKDTNSLIVRYGLPSAFGEVPVDPNGAFPAIRLANLSVPAAPTAAAWTVGALGPLLTTPSIGFATNTGASDTPATSYVGGSSWTVGALSNSYITQRYAEAFGAVSASGVTADGFSGTAFRTAVTNLRRGLMLQASLVLIVALLILLGVVYVFWKGRKDAGFAMSYKIGHFSERISLAILGIGSVFAAAMASVALYGDSKTGKFAAAF